MNAMPKKILARRVNNRATPIGTHFTVQKVIKEPGGKAFGFAVDDQGGSAFIPKPVILKHQMTEADEGAGFTAPTRPPAIGDGGAPQIMNPVVWDGEAEEVVVDEVEADRDYDGEIDTLIEKLEGVAKLVSAVDGLVNQSADLMRMAENHKSMATFIHNELTEVTAWLQETYPEDKDAV